VTEELAHDLTWVEAVASHLNEGAAVRVAAIEACTPAIILAAQAVISSLRAGGKVVFCGNGGSAADAQHLAAEFVGRYLRDRKALAAVALTTDTSVLTSISNDYEFNKIFERQVEALVRHGDVLIALSTSGESENIIRAISIAKTYGALTVGITGQGPCRLSSNADIAIRVPSNSTPIIQEIHIAIGHCICGIIEDSFKYYA